MSDFVALNPSSIHREIRNTLFGDVPLAELVRAHPKVPLAEPWAVVPARAGSATTPATWRARRKQCARSWRCRIWRRAFFCRPGTRCASSGDKPPQGREKEVLGVVVEIGMPKGLDLVAAYRDHRARYFNYSGAGVLWERRDDSLDGLIDELLQAGTVVAEAIGPWTKPKPPEPKNGYARINLLTPSGIHLGKGPVEALNQDAMGGPILVSGVRA